MEVRKEDQRDPDEKVVEIEIERLRDFKNHPFKVQADSQMKELQESIKKYGILNPLIVRPRPEAVYIKGRSGKNRRSVEKYDCKMGFEGDVPMQGGRICNADRENTISRMGG